VWHVCETRGGETRDGSGWWPSRRVAESPVADRRYRAAARRTQPAAHNYLGTKPLICIYVSVPARRLDRARGVCVLITTQ
jgi:hypothetical protein